MRRWHRWVGIVASLFLVSVSTTGVILQLQQLFGGEEAEREKVAATSSLYSVGSPLDDFAPKLAAGLKVVAARTGNTTPLDAVELHLKGDHPLFLFHAGGRRFTVNAESGRIEREETDERESLLLRLHTGEVFGDGGVVLGIVWGTALLALTLSGVFLYWQMYRARAKKYGWKRVFWLLSTLALAVPASRAEDHAPNRSETQDKNRDTPRLVPSEPESPSPLTATYVTTLNGSTRGNVKPSVNQRVNLDYSLPRDQILDLRVEYYTEGSYNADPPGERKHNINEPKFEGQLTYTAPVTDCFSLSGAVLHHENFRFPDTYWWGIVTAGYSVPLLDELTLAANISGEKRFAGGRPFLDFSGTLDYALSPAWTLEGNLHRYENYGQFDSGPTQKREYELAVLRKLPHGQFVGLSYFDHIQFGAPNDQFSFVKLKYGVTF